MCDKIQNLETEKQQSDAPYKHCLNCGTELTGAYCHACGQEASNPTPSIKSFIMEYVVNAFMWDSKLLETLWLLVRRPGYLTREFVSGKFISYMHPLKLNMFLLFIFITLFLLFSGTEEMSNSVHDITSDERVFPMLQMQTIADNQEYLDKINESSRDTIHIFAPLLIAEQYPEIINSIEVKEDTQGKALDKWVAIVPSVLIEENILTSTDDGYYLFNPEMGTTASENIDLLNTVWTQMVDLLSQYFPMLVLLTAPLLSFSLRLVQRKQKRPQIHHFIFALHYTAFLELLMLLIYTIFLIVNLPTTILQWFVIISSCAYLTTAFHCVYDTNSWVKAGVKALVTSSIYALICGAIFIGFCLCAFIVIAFKMA